MKRLIILATVMLVAALLTMVTVHTASAGPVKPDPYAGKTAGNSGFASFVDTNDPAYTGDRPISTLGWVRYSKNNKSLHTTWVVNGLQPGETYQLKLAKVGGSDARLAEACDEPGTGAIWECGTFWGQSFLVMDTVQADSEGHISAGVNETRLVSGDYSGMQFMVTLNEPWWTSYWTWENPPDVVSSFTIK